VDDGDVCRKNGAGRDTMMYKQRADDEGNANGVLEK